MNTEFDLDSIKGAWQAAQDEKNYSSKEIFNMLKRKSVTAVKWVFTISLIEIILAVSFYIYFFTKYSISEFHNDLIRDYGNLAYLYEAFNFIVYGVTFWFIWLFFKSYKKIRVQSSVRELSQDIIDFRKYVQYFIRFNLIMFFIISIFGVFSVWRNNPDLEKIPWNSPTGLGIIAGITFSILFFLGIVWLYYYLVYGTFQRRLKRNLKNLDSIE